MSEAPPVVQALTDPRNRAAGVGPVELIETHISWVFLAGDSVYKVKKPVDLGFLDFTTLDKRRFFCAEEVRLNQRLTHDVYLGVVELRGDDFRIGGAGDVREVAVHMRRLPQDRMLDQLVRSNQAEPALLEEIGRMVARFHAGAATGGEIDALGGLDTISANWRENFEQTAGFGADVLPDAWRREIARWVEAFMEREAARVTQRVQGGRSRDCHGDLQAQHVCCTERIQIFDCIEFNHRFRYGDVAGEIAFLFMDLTRLGRDDLAMRFVNAYLEESGDFGAVPLLDFYAAYRAFVRGKVLGFMVDTHPEAAPKAHERFALAHRYVQPRPPPRLLITSGIVGSGKSTVARALAGRLRSIVIRTDAVRKHLVGLAPTERGAQEIYTPAMSRRTYDECFRLAGEMLAAGWSVIVDGTFTTVAERDQARALASRSRVPLATIWCDAPDAVLADRLRRRAADPGEVSDAGPDLLSGHRERYEPPAGEPETIRVDTTAGPDAAVEATLRALSPS
ncbi:MAG TPA: AAA family ATPase [Candidatus Acidoferrum sp.]|nr:AAA family ATPase [Candidatus Acidoferrum sp.]